MLKITQQVANLTTSMVQCKMELYAKFAKFFNFHGLLTCLLSLFTAFFSIFFLAYFSEISSEVISQVYSQV